MNTVPNPHPDALSWLWNLVYDMRMGFTLEDTGKSTNWLQRFGYITASGQGGWQFTDAAEPLLLRFSRKLAERGMRCPPTEEERAKAHQARIGPDVGRWHDKA